MERPFKFHQLTLFVDYLYDSLDQLSGDNELGWSDIEGGLLDFEIDFYHLLTQKVYNRLDKLATTNKHFSYEDLLEIIENYEREYKYEN